MTSKYQSFSFRAFKLWLGTALFAALLSGPASATIAPQTMLETVTEEIISAFKREKEAVKHEPTHLFALVEEVLLPHVDMDVMSRYVLGKYWRTATEEQKERFRREFKDLLVRFYVSALLDDPARLDELLANSENLIKYLPVTIDDSTRKTTVRAEVTMPNGGPKIPVSFSLFLNTEGEWMMYDVNVDGISLSPTTAAASPPRSSEMAWRHYLTAWPNATGHCWKRPKQKAVIALKIPANDHRVAEKHA